MGNVRRGDIRHAVLAVLSHRPAHGYQIMQTIEELTDGVWRPSPGSVYPALQQFEDEGLVRSDDKDGRRVFDLTAEGRSEATARNAETGPPWERIRAGGDEVAELKQAMIDLEQAVAVAAHSSDLNGMVVEILRTTRSEIFSLLAQHR